MLSNNPELEITYFIPDDKKEGGRYETIVDNIKKIDNYKQQFLNYFIRKYRVIFLFMIL